MSYIPNKKEDSQPQSAAMSQRSSNPNKVLNSSTVLSQNQNPLKRKDSARIFDRLMTQKLGSKVIHEFIEDQKEEVFEK